LARFLDIDLTTGAIARRDVDAAVLERYVGGRGLDARRLFDGVGPGTDPLGPDNPLLITPGLLTGGVAPGSSRVHLGARSPLTGLLGSSNIGGRLGWGLRRAGVAGLAVTGVSPRPVYLWIDGDGAELRDAGEVWGMETDAAAAALAAAAASVAGDGAGRAGDTRRPDTHGGPAMLLIGPAGENLARIACAVTERGHAAGRTGMGAVMGAKRLKAVVVGVARAEAAGRDAPPPTAKPAIDRFIVALRAAPAYGEVCAYGTSLSVSWSSDLGLLSARNFSEPQFAAAAATGGEGIAPFVGRRHGCHGCPVHCKAEVRLAGGRFGELTGERPDFEPLAAWGARVGVDDPEAVLYLHNRCDRLGLDSISAAAAAGFAVDLCERGVIGPADTGGLELRWGDAEALGWLVEEMAAGRGFGGLLAAGVRHAAQAIGRGAGRYAYEVKGLELPAYDPRGAYGAALACAVSQRGGDFTDIYARQEFNVTPADAERLYGDEHAGDPLSPRGKAAIVRAAMVASAALDALGLCKIADFTLLDDYQLEHAADLASGVTGLDLTPGGLFATGERIVSLERLLNLRLGATASDDVLPAVFREEPLSTGPNRGSTVDLAGMRAEFYDLMGWSPQGVPTVSTLARLGLDERGADLPRETRARPPRPPRTAAPAAGEAAQAAGEATPAAATTTRSKHD
jgi:aldehyde:ferredoxin oxidoreductase